MKTRQEMIYDFMLALSANYGMVGLDLQPSAIAEMIYEQACAIADKYVETL